MRIIRSITTLIVAVLLIGSWTVSPARAQRSGEMPQQFEGVGIDRKLGDTIPADLIFRNAAGESVELGRYFDGERPVMLNLVWHKCHMICPRMLNGITSTLKSMSWTPGAEFQVLTVSFNPREGPDLARQKKQEYLAQLGKPEAEAGWHFLTGSEASIKALTEAVGFNFRWVPEEQQYAHPTATIFLSGTGTVTRYIYGMSLPTSDARTALVEASDGTVGNPVDQIALYCLQFDPNSNTYTADAFNIMKLAGVLTMIILGGVLFFFWRRERERLERTVPNA